MSVQIHPTAILDPKTQIGTDVSIGPYCVVGGDVQLGDGVKLVSHVALAGRTKVGAATVVYPFASLGHPPQDLKYHGEPSTLQIGSHNTIREHVTMNPGTEGGGMITRIGNHCLFMASAHVAHDCQIGDHVILANNGTLAGHVTVGDYAIIGGMSAIHQFVRVGAHAMVGGMSAVENDIIPYATVKGDRATLVGLNVIGLERRGFDRDAIKTLRSAYRMLFAPEGTMAERLEEVASLYASEPLVSHMVDFVRNRSSRPLCQPGDVKAA